MIFFGTTASPSYEAREILAGDGILFDSLRLRAFPFSDDVVKFIEEHERLFVIEQNRDGQMRRLLINECEVAPQKLTPILKYDGLPITARAIARMVRESLGGASVTPLRREGGTGETPA